MKKTMTVALVTTLVAVGLSFAYFLIRISNTTGEMRGNFYVRSESDGYVCAADDSTTSTAKLTKPLSREEAVAICDRLNVAAPSTLRKAQGGGW